MIRKLSFVNNELSKKQFEYIFHGLIIMGNQNTNKGLSVLNREISLLDKIEAISKPCDCGKKVPNSMEPDRELDFSDGLGDCRAMDIDDGEFDILYDYISRVPWSIGESGRGAVKTLNWLKNPNGSSPS